MTEPGATLAETLRRQIILGTYSPGQKLSESRLAEEFQVSRNTLREAFRVLSEQGLVAHVRHRGVTVSSPTIADVVDIYRTRRIIECGVLSAASPLHPGVAKMESAIERAESARARGDWGEVGSANMNFHDALVSLGDSARLSRVHGQLAAEMRLVFLAIDDAEALHSPFVARNRAILERLKNEGPETATAELEGYLIASERAVLGVFTRNLSD